MSVYSIPSTSGWELEFLPYFRENRVPRLYEVVLSETSKRVCPSQELSHIQEAPGIKKSLLPFSKFTVHCRVSLQTVRQKERQITRESLGRSADGYFAVPSRVDEGIGSNATLLQTFHLGSRRVSAASVLLVGLEAAMKSF
jgi:hypothetical protein